MTERVTLDTSDRHSGAWSKVKQYAAYRLGVLRGQLEGEEVTHERALVIRGQIKELKLLLQLDKDSPPT